MITEHLAKRSGSHPGPLLRGHGRRRAARYERESANESMIIRLREALAREEVLLGKNDKLMQKQKVLSKLFTSQETYPVANLTPRERQIMELVLAGHPSKNIAVDLGISQRTVENHRASIMKKTGSKSLPALARFALAAIWNGAGELPVQQSANSQEVTSEAVAAAS